LYLLKFKGKYFERFKEFKVLVEIQSEHKIKTIRSDNGREFITNAIFEGT
jgi:hypothetical protein